MMKLRWLLILAALLLVTASCRNKGAEVKFARFEKVLFDTQTDQLQGKLEAVRSDFASPLINCAPENPVYMQQLTAFVSDPFVKEIYRLTDSCYGNLSWLEKELSAAVGKAQKMSDSVAPKRYFTMITGDLEDYRNRVFCYGGDLVLSIDHYVLPYTQHIGYCNCPMYIVNLSDCRYIAADCMAAMARSRIAMPEGEPMLLDYIVMEGKVQYFLEQTMPSTPDTIRLRYTKGQLDWMQHSEKDVWGYFLQNNLLYERDMARIHNFIDEAPKTNAFRNSAPRTTDYLGLQIVRAYMKRSGASLDELFANTDSQAILQKSGFKPK
ncbi:MAG: hypothetical protein J5526_01315 [Bacteroidales bacterium]|nr:hypothetical protein [Bacteroidales bacterium]